MKNLELSNSYRQSRRVGCQLVRRGKSGELLIEGHRVSALQDERSFGGWLHNNVIILYVFYYN